MIADKAISCSNNKLNLYRVLIEIGKLSTLTLLSGKCAFVCKPKYIALFENQESDMHREQNLHGRIFPL